MVLKDLSEKKEELETAYLAAKEYTKVQKQKGLQEFNMNLARTVEHKVDEFRSQIKDKSISD